MRYVIATETTLGKAVSIMRQADVWSTSYGLVPGLHRLTDNRGRTLSLQKLRKIENENPSLLRAILVCTGIDLNYSYEDGYWRERAKVVIVKDNITHDELRRAVEDNTGIPYYGTPWERITL